VVCAEGIIPHLEHAYGISPGKVRLARFSFVNPDLYESIQEAPGDGFEIAYTGSLYSDLQDHHPFFRALSQIEGDALKLVILGPGEESREAAMLKGRLPNVKFHGWCAQETVIRVQKRATVLLIFGHRGGQQLPSKLYEYFAARRPIFCIAADEKDLAAKLVRAHRRGLVVENSEQRILAGLQGLLELYRGQVLDCEFDLEKLPQYTVARAVEDLTRAVLDEPGTVRTRIQQSKDSVGAESLAR
jgi:glycosyltransferase involved in cell wall biosynthesis